MLPVHKRPPVPRLTCLEKERISVAAGNKCIGGEHSVYCQRAFFSGLALSHGHDHIRSIPSFASATATVADILVAIPYEDIAFGHKHPLADVCHVCINGRFIG